MVRTTKVPQMRPSFTELGMAAHQPPSPPPPPPPPSDEALPSASNKSPNAGFEVEMSVSLSPSAAAAAEEGSSAPISPEINLNILDNLNDIYDEGHVDNCNDENVHDESSDESVDFDNLSHVEDFDTQEYSSDESNMSQGLRSNHVSDSQNGSFMSASCVKLEEVAKKRVEEDDGNISDSASAKDIEVSPTSSSSSSNKSANNNEEDKDDYVDEVPETPMAKAVLEEEEEEEIVPQVAPQNSSPFSIAKLTRAGGQFVTASQNLIFNLPAVAQVKDSVKVSVDQFGEIQDDRKEEIQEQVQPEITIKDAVTEPEVKDETEELMSDASFSAGPLLCGACSKKPEEMAIWQNVYNEWAASTAAQLMAHHQTNAASRPKLLEFHGGRCFICGKLHLFLSPNVTKRALEVGRGSTMEKIVFKKPRVDQD